MTPQPQEYIITSKELERVEVACINEYGDWLGHTNDVLFETIRSRPHTSTPQCPHWGINRIVPNDDNGEYSGFVDSWECCKPNNDTAIRKAEREKVLDLLKKNGYKGAVAFLKNPEKYDKSLRREP